MALTALRIYRRLPRFAQRRVRKRALRAAWPKVVSKLLAKRSDERR